MRAARTTLTLLLPLVLLPSVGGCFGPPEAPQGPPPASDLPPVTGERVLPAPPPLPPIETAARELPPRRTTSDDRLEVGMTLAVRVTGEPLLSVQDAAVGHDGAVFVPFLGRIAAAGRTPLELAEALEEALVARQYVKAPQVDVSVLGRGGRRVYVLGRVGLPGAYDLPFERNLTLLQVVALAGGMATGKNDLEADPTAVRLIRTVEGQRKAYRISLQDVIGRDDLQGDVFVEDGDTIFVPPKQELFIFGSVRTPGGFPLVDGGRLRVDEALSLAGGYGEGADRESVLLIRRTSTGGAQTYSVPEDAEARAQVEVAAGDTIIVPERAVRRVFVLGRVARQGGIALDEKDLTVTKVLALAGGVDRIAAANSVQLIRRGADGKKRVYGVPVGDIIGSGDIQRDPIVLPGDIIWVPEGFF